MRNCCPSMRTRSLPSTSWWPREVWSSCSGYWHTRLMWTARQPLATQLSSSPPRTSSLTSALCSWHTALMPTWWMRMAGPHCTLQPRMRMTSLTARFLGDAQEHEGWTLLYLATQDNFENMAWLLVSCQADPDLCEVEGKTPLNVAAYFGHVDLVELLTGQGTDLDAQQRNLRTPLHLAVEQGRVRAIQHLLKSGAAPDALDQNGYGPLHTAAAMSKFLICKMLLGVGPP